MQFFSSGTPNPRHTNGGVYVLMGSGPGRSRPTVLARPCGRGGTFVGPFLSPWLVRNKLRMARAKGIQVHPVFKLGNALARRDERNLMFATIRNP